MSGNVVGSDQFNVTVREASWETPEPAPEPTEPPSEPVVIAVPTAVVEAVTMPGVSSTTTEVTT